MAEMYKEWKEIHKYDYYNKRKNELKTYNSQQGLNIYKLPPVFQGVSSRQDGFSCAGTHTQPSAACTACSQEAEGTTA